MIFAPSFLLILNQIVMVTLFENFPLISGEFECSKLAFHHCSSISPLEKFSGSFPSHHVVFSLDFLQLAKDLQ